MSSTWESLTERLIRESQERGDFDDLPGQGRPLQLDDDPREGEMGLAYHLLRNARVAPPWIEADKDARASLEHRDRMLAQAGAAQQPGLLGDLGRQRLHRRLDQLIETHATAVARLNASAPSLCLHRRPLDGAAEHARLDEAIAIGSFTPAAAPERAETA